jgi:hypothetical protein
MLSTVEDDVELAVHIDDGAFAERAGSDLHVLTVLGRKRARAAGAIMLLICARPRIANGAKSPASSVSPALPDLPLPRPGGARRPRRPSPVPAGPQPDHQGVPRLVRGRDFEEVETAALQVSPGNEAHLHAFETQALTISGEAARSTCTPRRSSPARSCWRRAKSGSSASARCGAIASAGRCTIRSSPCWNGTGPGALPDPDGRLRGPAGPGGRDGGNRRFAFGAMACDPFAAPERLSVAEAFQRHAGVDLLASVAADGADRPRRPGRRRARRRDPRGRGR